MELLLKIQDGLRQLREQAQDSSLRAIHQFEDNQLQVLRWMNSVTMVFMWAYTIVSYKYMLDPIVWKIGFCCSFLHSLCIPIYRSTKSMALAASVLVATGGVFQCSFAMSDGGFFSATLIWVAILPLIAGVLAGILHAALWMFLSVLSVVLCFVLTKKGYATHTMDPAGADIFQFMIAAGIIFLVGAFTILALRMAQIYRKNLMEKNLQIQSLLRTMSHDVATPLTLLKFGVDRLQGSDPSNETLHKMLRAVNNISAILDHVRKLDALEAGKIIFDISEIRLHPVVHDCRVFHEENARKKDVTLDFQVPVDLMIQGNASILVNHVIGNLLSNSIKFSRPGERIEIRAEKMDNFVRVKVRDYGVGIAPERLAMLFSAGKANSTKGTNNESGTGFGMLLVKTYLEAMGATIQVDSWVGKGTEATLTFRV